MFICIAECAQYSNFKRISNGIHINHLRKKGDNMHYGQCSMAFLCYGYEIRFTLIWFFVFFFLECPVSVVRLMLSLNVEFGRILVFLLNTEAPHW